MMRDIDAGVDACRSECEYYSVCGGGAPVNKLTECGSFRATRTSYCSLTQMAPVDVILAAFERAERNPAAFDAYVKSEIERWEPILKATAEPPK